MKTLYIDVYFMINFTVDILAIFIALRIVHICVKIKKLILAGLVGGIFAIAELFMPGTISQILLAVVFVFAILVILCGGVSFVRKVKFLIAFYISTFLISGVVSYIYGLMDRYLKDLIPMTDTTTNRKALVFSLIILLLIGALRVFIMMFSDTVNEKSIRIVIDLCDKALALDAMVDTGNLVKDPMNMNPVIFIKRNYAEQLFPSEVIELSHLDSLTPDFRKRIRLIPVTRNASTHVMTGVRVDRVTVLKGKSKEQINATIVIDKEEGTYGGYYALAPYVAALSDD